MFKINAVQRLKATSRIEVDAAGDAWWNSLSKEQQDQYLKLHPKSKHGKGSGSSKAPTQKKRLEEVPKLEDLYQYSDKFSPEKNRQAEQEAKKEIERVKEQNRKASEENRKGSSERRNYTQETLKTHSPKDAGSAFKNSPKLLSSIVDKATQHNPKYSKMDPAQKKNALREDLGKSPSHRKNFMQTVLNTLKTDRSMSPEERKKMWNNVKAVSSTNDPKAIKELVDSMFR